MHCAWYAVTCYICYFRHDTSDFIIRVLSYTLISEWTNISQTPYACPRCKSNPRLLRHAGIEQYLHYPWTTTSAPLDMVGSNVTHSPRLPTLADWPRCQLAWWASGPSGLLVNWGPLNIRQLDRRGEGLRPPLSPDNQYFRSFLIDTAIFRLGCTARREIIRDGASFFYFVHRSATRI